MIANTSEAGKLQPGDASYYIFITPNIQQTSGRQLCALNVEFVHEALARGHLQKGVDCQHPRLSLDFASLVG